MPTRASRKDRCKKTNGVHSVSGAAPHIDTSDDCVEIGPLPDGVKPGGPVAFEHMAIRYEVAVPEGCGPGSYFSVRLGKENAGAQVDMACNANNAADGFPGCSDDSTCIDDSDPDPPSEEDPMWSTDWTIEQAPAAAGNTVVAAGDVVDWNAECCVQEQSDQVDAADVLDGNAQCCVEEQPDQVAFENCIGCEVFDLSDVTTWFARMQQRRVQALRAGKTKQVRKIDREINLELEKARQQGCTSSQAAFCNGEVQEEPVESDGIWGEDWATCTADDRRA